MIGVAYLPNCRHTENMYVALLTRRQAQQGAISFFCHQLCADTGTTCHLPATALFQLNIMDGCASRDILERQCIAYANIGLWASHNAVAHLQTEWGDNVSLLSIKIVQQCDTSGAVRIVFNGRYFRWNIPFV